MFRNFVFELVDLIELLLIHSLRFLLILIIIIIWTKRFGSIRVKARRRHVRVWILAILPKIVIWMSIYVNVYKVRDVFENVRHHIELIAKWFYLYLMNSSWPLIVCETRRKMLLGFCCCREVEDWYLGFLVFLFCCCCLRGSPCLLGCLGWFWFYLLRFWFLFCWGLDCSRYLLYINIYTFIVFDFWSELELTNGVWISFLLLEVDVFSNRLFLFIINLLFSLIVIKIYSDEAWSMILAFVSFENAIFLSLVYSWRR